ncbi:MAG: hypothetical protein WC197_06110 [Candidatus Gastranaerophilaceae bacterium]|jgi:hypothetical protein
MNNQNTLKNLFIGISIGSSNTDDSGICILNSENELIKVDKAYLINEIMQCINNIAGKNNAVICVDLPKYSTLLNGKWRMEAKPYRLFNINEKQKKEKTDWKDRFSERGTELCKNLISQGYELYRYNSDYTKTMLNINSYVKARTPLGCKFLQQAIREKLEVQGFPPNMIPLSALDAILGAYTAKLIKNGQKEINFKEISVYKNIPVICGLKTL